MSATQTNIEFKIIETSDADNVAFERGQYIIEDGSKAYYDPTTGESVSDRIEIGSGDINELKARLSTVYKPKGSISTTYLPTNNDVGDVWNITEDVGAGNIKLSCANTHPIEISEMDMSYSYTEENGVTTHQLEFRILPSSLWVAPDTYYCFDTDYEWDKLTINIEGFDTIDEDSYTGWNALIRRSISFFPINTYRISEYVFTVFKESEEEGADTVWQEIASEDRTINLISVPYTNSKPIPAGSNVVWVEPGYWDILSPFIDLSNYVTKTSYANSSVGGVVKVKSDTHGLNMDSGTLKISPATSVEIAAKTHGYKPITPSQIENAVAAGTHQNMSNSYNTGNKGNLPASYTAVKNYVDSTISSKLTGAYKIMGSIDTEDLEVDFDIAGGCPPEGSVYNIKSGTLNGYYVNNYTVAEEEPMESSTISTTSTTFQFKNPVGLLTLIPFLEHSVSVDLYADGYVSSETWDNSKVITAEFDSYFYDEEEDVLSITFVNLSKTFLPASIEPDVYIMSICDINFDLSLRAGDNVVWTPYGWDKLASDIDLTGYATTSYVDSLIGSLEDAIDEILTEGV